jgi:hypothetical protein
LRLKWAKMALFGPKIANFSEMADFHGTGHMPSERGSKCATFMLQTIYDDSPAFWSFFENRDFWTLLRPQNGPKWPFSGLKSRISPKWRIFTEPGICHPKEGQNVLLLCYRPYMMIPQHFGAFSKSRFFLDPITAPKWAKMALFGPKIANFSEMADFHGTGHMPSERGSKCATFMLQTIYDDSPAFWSFFENRDFWTLLRPQKWAKMALFGPKIANFSEMADFHGTGHIPSERGSKCATFMLQTIYDDSPAFWSFFENRDFWTLLRPKNGPKWPFLGLKSRISPKWRIFTEPGICHPKEGQNVLLLCYRPYMMIPQHFGAFSKNRFLDLFWPFPMGRGVLGYEKRTKSRISRAGARFFKFSKFPI